MAVYKDEYAEFPNTYKSSVDDTSPADTKSGFSDYNLIAVVIYGKDGELIHTQYLSENGYEHQSIVSTLGVVETYWPEGWGDMPDLYKTRTGYDAAFLVPGAYTYKFYDLNLRIAIVGVFIPNLKHGDIAITSLSVNHYYLFENNTVDLRDSIVYIPVAKREVDGEIYDFIWSRNKSNKLNPEYSLGNTSYIYLMNTEMKEKDTPYVYKYKKVSGTRQEVNFYIPNPSYRWFYSFGANPFGYYTLSESLSHVLKASHNHYIAYDDSGPIAHLAKAGRNVYGNGITGVDYGDYMELSVDDSDPVKLDYLQKGRLYIANE